MRKGLIVLLAAMLVAAFALPAMAEHSASGFIRTKAWVSNFANGGAGTVIPVTGDAPTNSYVETRARILYKAGTEDVKFVYYGEFDQQWGDSAYTTGRNTGGGLEADTTNLETKNIYVMFKVPNTSWDFKVGVQNQTDSYAGTFFGVADMAGVFANFKVEPVDVRLGWAKFWENSAAKADDVDLYVVEAKFTPMKEVKLGLNFYYLNDQAGGTFGPTSGAAGGSASSTIEVCVENTIGFVITVPPSGVCPAGTTLTELDIDGTISVGGFGGRGAAGSFIPSELGGSYDNFSLYIPGFDVAFQVGPAKLSGFFFYEFGTYETPGSPDVDVSGFAADVRADMNLGPGKFFVEGLYVTGDDNPADTDFDGIITASNYNLAGSFFYRMDMQILLPNGDDINTSPALAYEVSNKGAGLWAIAAGYSQNFTDKVKGKIGVGYAAAAEKRAIGANFASKSDMAFEVNGNVNYNISKGLDLGLYGAYAFLGSAYDVSTGPDRDDPYMLYARLNFGF